MVLAESNKEIMGRRLLRQYAACATALLVLSVLTGMYYDQLPFAIETGIAGVVGIGLGGLWKWRDQRHRAERL